MYQSNSTRGFTVCITSLVYCLRLSMFASDMLLVFVLVVWIFFLQILSAGYTDMPVGDEKVFKSESLSHLPNCFVQANWFIL